MTHRTRIFPFLVACLLSVPGAASATQPLDRYWASPADGDLVYDTVSIQGSSDREWETIFVEIDGVEHPAGDLGDWWFGWDTRTYPDGPVTLRIHGVDGHEEEWTPPRTVTVANPPPITKILQPGEGVLTGPTQISGYAYLPAGVASVALTARGPGGVTRTVPVTGTRSWSASFDPAGEPEGSWDFELVASDGNGATSSDAIALIVDTTAPVLDLDDPDEGGVFGPTVPLRGVASDAAAIDVIEVEIDGEYADGLSGVDVPGASGDTRSFEANLDMSWRPEGTHELAVAVSDYARRRTVVRRTITIDATGPSVTFDTPSGLRVAGAVTLAGDVADPRGVAGVTVRVDEGTEHTATISGGRWSLPFDTDTLPEGRHRFEAVATDLLGNRSTTSRHLDVARAPTVTFDVPTASTLWGTVRFGGSVTDEFGVAEITVSVTGVERTATLDGSSWFVDLDTEAVPDGFRQVAVTATNVRGYSGSAYRSFHFENAPDISILSPTTGAWLRDVTEIHGTATDPQGVTRVTVSVDGGPQRDAVLSGTTWRYALDTLDHPDGVHMLAARAFDARGNVTLEDVRVRFTNGSNISITPVNEILGGTRTVSGTVYVTGGAHAVLVKVDGSPVGHASLIEQPGYAYLTWRYALDTSGLADWGHTLEVVALRNGNAVATAETRFSTDNTLPALAVSSPTDGQLLSSVVPIAFSASDNMFPPTVEARIRGSGEWYAWVESRGEPWGTLTLPSGSAADGPHTVEVRAVDHAGNVRLVAVDVVIDRAGPVVDVTAPTPRTWYGPDIDVVGTVTDALGVRELVAAVDSGPWAPVAVSDGAFTIALRDLSGGSHDVRLRAVDGAGNVSTRDLQFLVDITPPTLEVLEPTLGKVNTGVAPDLPAPGGRTVVHRGHVVFTPYNDSQSGRDTITFCLSPGLSGAACETGTSPFSGILMEAHPGEVRLTVTARDVAGNTTTLEIDLLVV